MARRSMGVADVKEILVHWDAGEGISVIARELGYSRPTVRKYVQAAEHVGLVRGGGRRAEAAWEELAERALGRVAKPVAPGEAMQAVACYRDYLDERVGQVRLSVLFQRLRDDHELAVSWASFYRYVRAQWPDRLRPPVRVTVRLEDPPPGDEAQIDFFFAGRWVDPTDGRRHHLYGFLMTLGHSRHQFLYPVLGEDLRCWLEAHVAAFAFFGGAPRRLVPDNLTAGILRPDRYDPRVNRAYGELTRYYGCVVDPARVRRPTDKPKVERNVDYARESFFRDRDFASMAAMREDAVRWSREVAGRRIHGTTGQRPLEAFRAVEQAALLPLPPRPWELVSWVRAKVHADCHLQADGSRYSVPYRFVGQHLDVRLGAQMVEIYQGATLITSHVRRIRGVATREDHYPEAAQAYLRATPEACRARAQQVGKAAATLVADLLATSTRHHLREVQALLRLAERHPPEQVDAACRRALAAGDGRYRTVRGILERGAAPALVEGTTPTTVGAFLRGAAALVRAALEGA